MKPFPWRPGMLDLFTGLRWSQGGDYPCRVELCVRRGEAKPSETDPATLGALLGAVRELHRDPGMFACSYEEGWYVSTAEGCSVVQEPALSEFAALMTAWAKTP